MHTSATSTIERKGPQQHIRSALRRALDHHEDAADSARTVHVALEELVVDDVLSPDDPELARAVATLREVQREIGRARKILESLLEVGQ